MLRLTKTVEEDDYANLSTEIVALETTKILCDNHNVRIDIGHRHRYWEYAMAIKSYNEWYKQFKNQRHILDVGSGVSLLAPTMIFSNKIGLDACTSYWEVEPDVMNAEHRGNMNKMFHTLGVFPNNQWINGNIEDVVFAKQDKFNVIYSISVLEHIGNDVEFLNRLIELLAPNGLLFLTMDIVPEKGRPYTFDNLRKHNYDVSDLASIVEMLKRKGLKSFGEVDFEFKGVQVYDYTFGSLAMVKE